MLEELRRTVEAVRAVHAGRVSGGRGAIHQLEARLKWLREVIACYGGARGCERLSGLTSLPDHRSLSTGRLGRSRGCPIQRVRRTGSLADGRAQSSGAYRELG